MALMAIEYTQELPVEFVILLAFLAGCVEFLMGVLNLGDILFFVDTPKSKKTIKTKFNVHFGNCNLQAYNQKVCSPRNEFVPFTLKNGDKWSSPFK